MEKSELQEQVINLGKQLVKEYKLDPGVDTFSKWMVHYIAEKMKILELALSDKDRIEAEKECFETILAFWKHRWDMPAYTNPLNNFKSIFATLGSLDPENQDPYFYNEQDIRLIEFEKGNPKIVKISEYSEKILRIDKSFRVLIDFYLKQAVSIAHNQNIEDLCDTAINLPDNEDTQLFKKLVDYLTIKEIYIPSIEYDAFHKYSNSHKIETKILQLQELQQFCNVAIESYKNELNAIE